MKQLTGAHRVGNSEQFSEKRRKGAEFVRGDVHDYDAELEFPVILLVLDAFVNRDEYIELALHTLQKWSVFDGSPSHLGHGLNLIVRESSLDTSIYALIKEDTHSSRRSFANSMNWIACSRVTAGKPARNSSIVDPPSR